MGEGINEVPLLLPREAASPRHVARASSVWRLFQEAAVQASSQQGWTPERYTAAGMGFVLARMVAVHHDELRYGLPLQARTWVRGFKRRTISEREIRLHTPDGLVASASQRWAHVSSALKVCSATPEFAAAFPIVDVPGSPPVSLPELAPAEGPEHAMALSCWYSWLDPFGHVNHPTYLEWCDEHTARLLAAAGVDPALLQPVAEQIHYRSGVSGGDPIAVRTRLVGVGEGGRVVGLRHEIVHPETGAPYARAQTIRRLADGRELAGALS